jgi:hypothetical protein
MVHFPRQKDVVIRGVNLGFNQESTGSPSAISVQLSSEESKQNNWLLRGLRKEVICVELILDAW